MATFNTPIITNQGLEFLKSAVAGHDRLIFSNIVFSSQDLSNASDDDIAKMDDLTDKDMVNAPTTMRDKLTGELKIRSVGYNNSTSQAFYIRTYGLYATNQAGKELLIAVAIAQEPDFVPANNGKQVNQLTYTFNFNLSKTDNIQFSDEHDIGVTQADLDAMKDAVNNAQSVVKNIDLSSVVKQANSYTDASINSYATDNQSQMSSALSSAGSVAVNNATNALSSANSYTDSKTANATQNANSYTDTSIKNLDIDDKLKNVGFSYKGYFTSSDDLNHIFDTGMYYVMGAKNSPTNDYSILLVYNAGGYYKQEFIDASDCTHYERIYGYGDNWTAWHQLATTNGLSNYAKASDLSNYAKASDAFTLKKNLNEDDNLNNIIQSGFYYFWNAKNAPSGHESILIVYQAKGLLWQEVFDTYTQHSYARTGFGTSINSSWTRLATTNDLPDTSKFATTEQLADKADKSALSGYATTAQLSGYAKQSDLSGYAKTTQLPDLSGYAKVSQLPDMSGYAKITQLPDMNDYAKTSQLPDLSGYAKVSQLPDMSGYAKTTQLPDMNDYAKTSQLPDMSGYAKVSQLPNMSGYAKQQDLTDTDDKIKHTYQYRGVLGNDEKLDTLIYWDDGYWSTGGNNNVKPDGTQQWGIISKIHYGNNVVITYNDVWGNGLYKRYHRDDGWIGWSKNLLG